jgi:hypothetical protein
MNDDDDEPENEPKEDPKKDEAGNEFYDKKLEKLFFEKEPCTCGA